jgi:hypothetical protein
MAMMAPAVPAVTAVPAVPAVTAVPAVPVPVPAVDDYRNFPVPQHGRQYRNHYWREVIGHRGGQGRVPQPRVRLTKRDTCESERSRGPLILSQQDLVRPVLSKVGAILTSTPSLELWSSFQRSDLRHITWKSSSLQHSETPLKNSLPAQSYFPTFRSVAKFCAGGSYFVVPPLIQRLL